MTIKEALKTSKTITKRATPSKTITKRTTASKGEFWEVRLDMEVVEQVHITEYVKASSKLEAQAKAFKHLEKRTPEIVCDGASRAWQNAKRYSVQNLRITKTEGRKRFSVSENQRKILEALINGKYLKRNYTRWYLVDPTTKDNWGDFKQERVMSISVNSLFQKGLLTDLIAANMSEQEVKVQTAVGSMPTLKAYTIDKEAAKSLGLRL